MQYAIHESVIPPRLRSRGARVWVGDSMLHADVLRKQGLRAVSVLMWKDVYGEICILFAMPDGTKISAEEIAQCRHCALEWISQWEVASQQSSPSFPPALAVRQRARSKQASTENSHAQGTGRPPE